MLQMHAQMYLELKVESDFVFVSLATKLGQKWNPSYCSQLSPDQNAKCLGRFSTLFSQFFDSSLHLCRVLGISNIGAKCDFEIWRFKGFLSLDNKKQPLKWLLDDPN